ncbi:CRISPR-associated helicase Cas3' [Laribacter hongkongensis]|uniref:CRISPR-associated helicase Cas3' n=1 Tax=Laribacter hongkongensis TaxID=168471 RepID=UPI001EFCDA0E|nr:CRISPR-associated helicase Cas3' [Laribacter hongkongensis]
MDSSGQIKPGHDVFTHCLVVGEVARELLRRWPLALRTALMPLGAELVAACHDIGKVSPTFYLKIRKHCAADSLPPLDSHDFDAFDESQWGGHASVSQAAALAMGVPPLLAEVLGQHHGNRPNLGSRLADCDVFGGQAWQAERVALVDALKDALQTSWPGPVSPSQARMLAGLTSVADWIGSGPHFENPDEDWRPRIAKALDEAGFVPPRIRAGLSFTDLFGFAPRSIQQSLVEIISGPGVYILEAPMGLGKTEAALYAAYRLMANGQASGIYFALPTQLTSNKLYERFVPFLQTMLQPDCIHQQGLLLHGMAWLAQTQIGEEGRPGGEWFQQSKRGLLAPFAVGTVDQALMAVMNVKHGFVRAFGLAGKVVILDEVHSYDLYTGTILQQLVSQLREWGCTVIILSATLTQARREQLLQARGTRHDYPLISALPVNADTATEWPAEAPPSRLIRIQQAGNDSDAMDEVLRRAEAGQQVLWVENTVAEAQAIYQTLAARAANLGVACGLLHSRFTHRHRQLNEQLWVDLFGKNGWKERHQQGRVLIGTQVLEQSLDIDADFLVTRFAPTDLLLQRLGRLWRHTDTPRAGEASAEAWLLVPDLASAIADPYTAFGASAAVYSPYVLCRSLQSWQAITGLTLPDDIRPLLEHSYAEQAEEGDMARWQYELANGETRQPYRRKGTESLQRLALATLATAGTTESDTNPSTRYSEQDTQDVLLLRRIRLLDDGRSELTLLNGDLCHLPQSRHRLTPKAWRELSIILQAELVKLRPASAPPVSLRKRLVALGLGNVFYIGSPEADYAPLRVALVDEQDRVLTLDGQPVSDKYDYRYRDDLGYQRVTHRD